MPTFKGLSVPSVRLVLSYVFDWICIMYVNRRVLTHCGAWRTLIQAQRRAAQTYPMNMTTTNIGAELLLPWEQAGSI